MNLYSHNTSSQEPIIDFIEEQEVHEFAKEMKNKNRIITFAVITTALTLFAVSVYVLPDFLSDNHKNAMKYTANISTSSKHEINTQENISENNLHGTEN